MVSKNHWWCWKRFISSWFKDEAFSEETLFNQNVWGPYVGMEHDLVTDSMHDADQLLSYSGYVFLGVWSFFQNILKQILSLLVIFYNIKELIIFINFHGLCCSTNMRIHKLLKLFPICPISLFHCMFRNDPQTLVSICVLVDNFVTPVGRSHLNLVDDLISLVKT